MKIEVSSPEEVVKEAFWLAWRACGTPQGMGWLQNNPGATKKSVWENVRSAADYGPGAKELMRADESGKARGDYVFGRMMKLSIQWDATSVTVSDSTPKPDYQSWCKEYPTYAALIAAAVKNVRA